MVIYDKIMKISRTIYIAYRITFINSHFPAVQTESLLIPSFLIVKT